MRIDTVPKIVAEFLKNHNFDGLCSYDCGCGLDDLMPCGDLSNVTSCTPAHAVTLTRRCGDFAKGDVIFRPGHKPKPRKH